MRTALGLAAALSAGLGSAQTTPKGLSSGIAFSQYSPFARSSELLGRMASPLTVQAARRALAGRSLDETPIDLERERFVLYVPPREPAGGYGLLVFVPPWNEAILPAGWQAPLDHAGVIFVSAAGSGNDANVIGRREPLALIAEANVASRYPINPTRVYMSGFSGGAHVAERLALAFPDIFTGALLDAGADPIGDHSAPIPTTDLFARFQARSQLYLITGSKDQSRLDMAADTLSSLAHWCVANVASDEIPDAGHRIADPAALERGLKALEASPKSESARLSACREGLAREVARAIDRVEGLIAAGHLDEARKALIALDARFGGLAAPRSLALSQRLAGG